MSNNNNLGNSRERKYDEFYTQLSDIEAELCHYKNHFKGKTVFCNCDDPYESNFFKYFALNFKALGLKKLITTGYYTSPIAGKELKLFEDEKDVPVNQPYVVYINNTDDITEEMQIHRIADVATLLKNKHNTRRKLYGDNKYPAGDFRSEESVALLKQADIVVTNPPFSLFREFVAQLVECGKKFLIIGNKNAITYKNFFPLIKDNKVWIGFYSPAKFNVGYSCELKNMTGLCRWFTNLSLKKQSDQMVLWQRYYDDNGSPLPDIEKKYPKYDNYDAINVDKVQDIPCDYFGVMGVPITFLDKYNPSVLGDDMLSTGGGQKQVSCSVSSGLTDTPSRNNTLSVEGQQSMENPNMQGCLLNGEIAKYFEIVWQAAGNTRVSAPYNILYELKYIKNINDKGGCPVIKNKRIYARILIQRRKDV